MRERGIAAAIHGREPRRSGDDRVAAALDDVARKAQEGNAQRLEERVANLEAQANEADAAVATIAQEAETLKQGLEGVKTRLNEQQNLLDTYGVAILSAERNAGTAQDDIDERLEDVRRGLAPGGAVGSPDRKSRPSYVAR